ncbi:MAG: hypothetical protein ACXVAM_11455 [Vulcanimicrobiaceae bacterium]
MAKVFTHREFKLLLQPDRFPTKRSVAQFGDQLAQIAKKADVQYNPFESIDSQSRQVRFFDTQDQLFRNNHLIFRLRRDVSGGWPDETWEVTFKKRTPDYAEAAEFDVSCSAGLREKRKFKEEILRGDSPGTIRRIFSNNNVLDSPVINFTAPLSRIVELFPGLKSLGFDETKTVSAVNDVNVVEIQAKLGSYDFGKNAVAEAGLAVWLRPNTDKFDVLVAEFGFAYHVMGVDKKEQKAHDAADEFFKELQIPLEDMLAKGTTKTALIYDIQASEAVGAS